MTETAQIILDLSELKESGVYNNGDVAIFRNLQEMSSKKLVIGFYAIILCTAGRGSVNINGTTYQVNANDVVIGMPNIIIENALTSVDFKCCGICFRMDYLEKLIPISDQNWQLRFMFEQNPLVHLSEENVSTFLLYYNLILSRINHSTSKYLKNVIDSLLVAFMYDSRATIDERVELEPRSFSSKETHFKAFIELLTSTYPKNRSVQYYADQLCITPKYLSTICKSISNKSASHIINMYVEKDIEYQLCHTQKSIKEISALLGFPSISFFGKYVKSAFGKSPKAIRETMSRAQPTLSAVNAI